MAGTGTGSATNISGADSLPEADYSIPHRSPPPIPRSPSPRIQPWVASPSLPPEHLPPRKSQASLRRKAQAQAQEDSVSVSASEHKRRGSFGVGSFLRRTASGKHWKESGSGEGVEDVPPLPNYKTRIAQVEAEGRSSTNSRKISGEGRSMFRSTSKAQKELERQTREAERNAQMNRPPPQLNPLPDTGTFGNDSDPRPDSVAIFNNHYRTITNTGHTPSVPNNYRANNNFSRPGNNMPPSSSPAYAVRGGSGYGSSPNMTVAAAGKVNGSKEYVVERSESMTNRGRYSYASSMAPVNVSSPRRVRRRKDPTPFNVLVVGAKNSGKSSLISFLRHSLALPTKQASTNSPPETSTYNASKSSFTSHYLETEMDGERMGLTLWDSAGLEKNIVDLQLREMATFVESKFEETFVEEQKVMRSPGVKDTHIHCVFLILDPVRLDANIQAAQNRNDAGLDRLGGLDNELDLQVLRVLWGKTTVIPIVSKADTLTIGHMSFLKRAVWESVKGAKLDPLEALELEDDMAEEDEEDEDEDEDASDAYSDAHSNNNEVIDNLADDSSDSNVLPASKPMTSKAKPASHNRNSSLSVAAATADDETPYIPMSILSPDPYDLPPYTSKAKSTTSSSGNGNGKEQVVGRRFPWGFADPYDSAHCDFTRLRDSIFSEWRQELRDLSRSKWYENWRTSRLKNVPGSTRRVRGGVTPVASVPREGRSSPMDVRVGSGGNVPRSVSGGVTNGNVVPAEGRPSQAGAGLGAVREAAV